MRTLPALLLLATSATASADHLDWRTPASLPQNQQPMTEARYQEKNPPPPEPAKPAEKK